MPYYVSASIRSEEVVEVTFDPPWRTRQLVHYTSSPEPLPEAMVRRFPKTATLVLERGQLSPPDMMGKPGDALINEALKNQIEALEPNLHSFIPVDVLDQRGNHHGCYYYHCVHHFADTLDYDRTRFLSGFGLEAGKASHFSFRDDDGERWPIVMHQNLSANRHFWRGTEQTNEYRFFCSDLLGDFIKQHRMKGWRLGKVQV